MKKKDYSHYHCWNQGHPPSCGIPIEKHIQCCLCDEPAPGIETKSTCCNCHRERGTVAVPCLCDCHHPVEKESCCECIPVKGENILMKGGLAYGECDCKCHHPVEEKAGEEWEKEFDEKFVDLGRKDRQWWKTDLDYDYTATPPSVKDFIRETLASAKARWNEDLVRELGAVDSHADIRAFLDAFRKLIANHQK